MLCTGNEGTVAAESHVLSTSSPCPDEKPERLQQRSDSSDANTGESSFSSAMMRDLKGEKLLRKGALLVFGKEDEKAIKPLEDVLRQFCLHCFGIPEEDVLFVYCNRHGSTYPFYGDLKSKCAFLELFGVEPSLVRKHKTRLVHCIAGFLKTSPHLIHFLEVILVAPLFNA